METQIIRLRYIVHDKLVALLDREVPGYELDERRDHYRLSASRKLTDACGILTRLPPFRADLFQGRDYVCVRLFSISKLNETTFALQALDYGPFRLDNLSPEVMSQEDMKSKLFAIRKTNEIDNHYFYPSDAVLRVVQSSDLKEILLNSGVKDFEVDELITTILQGAWNAFAILVLTGKAASFAELVVDDRLQQSSIDNRIPFVELQDLKRIFRSETTAQEFYDNQWGFAAPSFSGSIFNRRLHDKFVLPFLEEKELGEGSFGIVTKVLVAESHQRFIGEGPYRELVRKRFRPERPHAEADHMQELLNLSILKALHHPNVVRLLGSFTYKGYHNLLYVFANGGTLNDLLTEPQYSYPHTTASLIVALSGLSSALSAVHAQFASGGLLNRIGCHHDLKPNNILIHNGNFVLADFGLSRFKDASQPSDTSYKNVGGYYVAPECDGLAQAPQSNLKPVIGRSSDIWSLGCAMLEVMVYAYEGQKGVSDFEDERTFKIGGTKHHRFHRGPHEREPAVDLYLKKIKDSSTFRSERDTAALIDDILVLNPDVRPGAQEVEVRMRLIALDTLAENIDALYSHVWGVTTSLGTILEWRRFSSWWHVYKLSYHPDPQGWRAATPTDFEQVFHCLQIIRDHLQDARKEGTDFKTMAGFDTSRLNDMLLETIQENLFCAYRTELRARMVDSPLEPGIIEFLKSSKKEHLEQIGSLMLIKQMNAWVEERTQIQQPALWIKPSQFDAKPSTVGTYFHRTVLDDRPIVYESKRYGQHQLDSATHNTLHCRLERITEQLIESRPAGLKVLPCIGYFHDTDNLSCGLVYELPGFATGSGAEILTLRDVFERRKTKPMLGNRIELAAILASSLLEFHKVGWLQKELSSFNILFVFETGTSWRNEIASPYFIGFSNSRPNKTDAFSEFMDRATDIEKKEFQHPEYLSNDGKMRYRAEFDYYSLGLVLFELGLWEPLRNLFPGGHDPNLGGKLIEMHGERLGQRMGGIYRDAASACLEEQIGNDADSMFAFEKHVLEPLRRCVV